MNLRNGIDTLKDVYANLSPTQKKVILISMGGIAISTFGNSVLKGNHRAIVAGVGALCAAAGNAYVFLREDANMSAAVTDESELTVVPDQIAA